MSDKIQEAAEAFNSILKDTLTPIHFGDVKIHEFIAKYLELSNINQAAKACKLSLRDGKYLFNQPDIYKAITLIQTNDVEKFGYQGAEIVARTGEIANLDPADLVNPKTGTYYENMHDIPKHARMVIKEFVAKNIFEEDHNGIPQYKGKLISVKLWSKEKALEMLGREKDLFKKTQVVQHDISKNARQYLLGSLNRGDQAKALLNAPQDPNIIDTVATDVTPKSKFNKPPGVK